MLKWRSVTERDRKRAVGTAETRFVLFEFFFIEMNADDGFEFRQNIFVRPHEKRDWLTLVGNFARAENGDVCSENRHLFFCGKVGVRKEYVALGNFCLRRKID